MTGYCADDQITGRPTTRSIAPIPAARPIPPYMKGSIDDGPAQRSLVIGSRQTWESSVACSS